MSTHPIEDKAGAPGTGVKTIARSGPYAPRSRSTATDAQRDRILAMLRTGEKSTFDFRKAGVMQTSTRIHELRARGHSIMTVARRDLFDADGFRHERVAIYALAGDPATADGARAGAAEGP